MNDATEAMIKTGGALATNGGRPTEMRQTFTGSELALSDGTSQALATAAKAEVESRILAAKKWPRDWLDVRSKVLAACKRPRFAGVARYAKPMGKCKPCGGNGRIEGQACGGCGGDGKEKIRGWGVRFAEECARSMGNLYTGSVVIYDDDRTRLLKVFAVDLESNTSRDALVTVTKTVERKFLKKGQQAIGQRINSYGDLVNIVEATDDDVLTKANALISKAWRNLVLQLVPGDITDEALDVVAETQRNADAEDPAAAVKKIADGFEALGVKPSALKDLLGHDIAACSPAEIATLRGYYTAIKGGETTWAEIVRAAEGDEPTEPSAKAAEVIAAVERAKGKKKPDPAPVGLAGSCNGSHAAPACADPGCIHRTQEPGANG